MKPAIFKNLAILTTLTVVGSALPAKAITSSIFAGAINAGITAALNEGTSSAFNRQRTTRTNYRVKYTGAGNYSTNKRFKGQLRSYKSVRGDVLISHNLFFSGDVVESGDGDLGFGSIEGAKASYLRLRFPSTTAHPETICDTKAIRVQVNKKAKTTRVVYALDARVRRQKDGSYKVTSRRGLCKVSDPDGSIDTVPNLSKGESASARLIVAGSSPITVLSPSTP